MSNYMNSVTPQRSKESLHLAEEAIQRGGGVMGCLAVEVKY